MLILLLRFIQVFVINLCIDDFLLVILFVFIYLFFLFYFVYLFRCQCHELSGRSLPDKLAFAGGN